MKPRQMVRYGVGLLAIGFLEVFVYRVFNLHPPSALSMIGFFLFGLVGPVGLGLILVGVVLMIRDRLKR